MDGFGSAKTLTMSDGTNTYVSRGTISDTRSNFTTTLLDCLTPTPGTYTLTLAGATGGGPQFLILIYTGISSYSAGSFASANFAATVPSTTDGVTTSAITPTSYSALIISGAFWAGGTPATAAGTGFTSRFAYGSSGFPQYAEDLTLSSGSNIASWTSTAGQADVNVVGAAYILAGGACTSNFWTSSGTYAIPNGSSGSYWNTATGSFTTPNCSTGSYWQKSGAIGSN
jgi:hypothetical protein